MFYADRAAGPGTTELCGSARPKMDGDSRNQRARNRRHNGRFRN
jgi:outer membrane protein OmpA-like peptidoglycan-associated protein